MSNVLLDIGSSATCSDDGQYDEFSDQGMITTTVRSVADSDIVLAAYDILREDNRSYTDTTDIKDEDCNVVFEDGWISFAVSLFPNARYFTKDEQKAFERYKREHFKRIKLNF